MGRSNLGKPNVTRKIGGLSAKSLHIMGISGKENAQFYKQEGLLIIRR